MTLLDDLFAWAAQNRASLPWIEANVTFTFTTLSVPPRAEAPKTTFQGFGPLSLAPRPSGPLGFLAPAYFQGTVKDPERRQSMTVTISAPSIAHPVGGGGNGGGFGYEVTTGVYQLALDSNGVDTGSPQAPTGSLAGSPTALSAILPPGDSMRVDVALAQP